MTADERTEPDGLAGEREMLEGRLDFHRATLAVKCAGVSTARRATDPVSTSAGTHPCVP
ncbi:hypothetical protein [Streptomyces sp. TRM49041]|uniref:hypothetical protein n=1 Tax=Streptomyces sp. TRM49041 TaxID=2603216 RepID=UPI0037DA1751